MSTPFTATATDPITGLTGSLSSSFTVSGTRQPTWNPSGYTVTFSDEFTGTSLDTTKWDPEWFDQGTASGPGNTALETCGYNVNHVSVSGGYLNLLATNTPITTVNGSYPNTGSCVTTRHIYNQSYGAFEARIFLPAANSPAVGIANWPAWWLTSTDNIELDILEGLSAGQAAWHWHNLLVSGGASAGAGYEGTAYTGWHNFGAEWRAGSITVYYDGVNVGSTTVDMNGDAMFLVLTNTTSSSYPGQVVLPATMLVDWVYAWA